MEKITAKNPKKITVLASMLDWGLGHTTRSIPILKEFVNQLFTLIVAGTQSQISLLKKEIPQANYVFLEGYKIRYSSGKFSFFLKILGQMPKILFRIFQENNWVKAFINQHPVDIIYSDNRPGFRNKRIYSLYLSHQLTIKTGNTLLSKVATAIHRFFINRFNECWIPDDQNNRIAGKLSEYPKSDIKVNYIGLLSRFYKIDMGKKYNLCVILSGPEPQRTILEKIIINQLKSTAYKTLILRGLPSENTINTNITPNIISFNHLSTNDLNKIISESEIVICRSGYSSIMDLISMGSKAILIPTPGQGEQEYLAKYLSEKKYFISANQDNFSLIKCVEQINKAPLTIPIFDFSIFKKYVSDLNHVAKQKK